MKALAFKELRELRGIAAAALVCYLGLVVNLMGAKLLNVVPGVARGTDEVPFTGTDYVTPFSLISGVFAVALGFRQSAVESASGTFLYLLHRPLPRDEIMLTKLASGLAVFFVCASFPVVAYGVWAAIPGHHPSPFEWSMTAPAWRAAHVGLSAVPRGVPQRAAAGSQLVRHAAPAAGRGGTGNPAAHGIRVEVVGRSPGRGGRLRRIGRNGALRGAGAGLRVRGGWPWASDNAWLSDCCFRSYWHAASCPSGVALAMWLLFRRRRTFSEATLRRSPPRLLMLSFRTERPSWSRIPRWARRTFRDLQGNLVSLPGEDRRSRGIQSAFLKAQRPPPTDDVDDWNLRIRAFADGMMPATFWYLISDGRAQGSAYFVGYDSESKRRVGFIGTAGFREESLPAEERFPFSGSTAGTSRAASSPCPLPRRVTSGYAASTAYYGIRVRKCRKGPSPRTTFTSSAGTRGSITSTCSSAPSRPRSRSIRPVLAGALVLNYHTCRAIRHPPPFTDPAVRTDDAVARSWTRTAASNDASPIPEPLRAAGPYLRGNDDPAAVMYYGQMWLDGRGMPRRTTTSSRSLPTAGPRERRHVHFLATTTPLGLSTRLRRRLAGASRRRSSVSSAWCSNATTGIASGSESTYSARDRLDTCRDLAISRHRRYHVAVGLAAACYPPAGALRQRKYVRTGTPGRCSCCSSACLAGSATASGGRGRRWRLCPSCGRIVPRTNREGRRVPVCARRLPAFGLLKGTEVFA